MCLVENRKCDGNCVTTGTGKHAPMVQAVGHKRTQEMGAKKVMPAPPAKAIESILRKGKNGRAEERQVLGVQRREREVGVIVSVLSCKEWSWDKAECSEKEEERPEESIQSLLLTPQKTEVFLLVCCSTKNKWHITQRRPRK